MSAHASSPARPFSLSLGRPGWWVRPALVGVLALAAVLCLWGLTASGYSNTHYTGGTLSRVTA